MAVTTDLVVVHARDVQSGFTVNCEHKGIVVLYYRFLEEQYLFKLFFLNFTQFKTSTLPCPQLEFLDYVLRLYLVRIV